MTSTYREFHYAAPDGVKLFCRDYAPEKPAGTVLCLAGITRNSRDFTALAQALSARYRVLTPDLRGRGHSEWDANFEHYHPKIYYQDLLTLLANEVRGPVAVIGTSLGGILAMSLASLSPHLVAGIVINDIGPELAPAGVARLGTYVGLRATPGSWAEAAAQMRATYEDAYPDFGESNWMAFAQASHREREDGTVVADYDPAIGKAMRAQSVTPLNLWPMWATLKLPALAIRGLRSDLLSAETFDRMAAEKPDLVRIEVPNRGHVPMLIEPEVLAGIERFLAGIFP